MPSAMKVYLAGRGATTPEPTRLELVAALWRVPPDSPDAGDAALDALRAAGVDVVGVVRGWEVEAERCRAARWVWDTRPELLAARLADLMAAMRPSLPGCNLDVTPDGRGVDVTYYRASTLAGRLTIDVGSDTGTWAVITRRHEVQPGTARCTPAGLRGLVMAEVCRWVDAYRANNP